MARQTKGGARQAGGGGGTVQAGGGPDKPGAGVRPVGTDREAGLRHRQGQSQEGAGGAPGEGVVRAGQTPLCQRQMAKHLGPGRKDGQGCPHP